MAKRLEKLLKRAKSHPAIIILVAFAAILTFVTDTPEKISEVISWANSTFGRNVKNYEMLAQVFNGESRQNLESSFGIPKTESQLTNNFVVCTYGEKDVFRLVAVYEDKTLVAYSVTTQKRGFNPTFQITSERKLKLGRETFLAASTGDEPVEWQVSTMPKDLLYSETSYLGNERNYETCLLAYSEFEGAHNGFDDNSAYWLDGNESALELNKEINLTPEQKKTYLKKFREKSVPNVVGFSALYLDGISPSDLGFDINQVLIYSGEPDRWNSDKYFNN